MGGMSSVNRHKLHFGPYRTPRFKYGAKVECQARGEVTIWKLSAGRIPWPMGKTHKAVSLVVYKGLARAIRREAGCAVRHWWGVGTAAITKWRRALGVPAMNEGDRRLKRAYAKTDWAKAARVKAWSKARDPARRAKISAAKRGKPRPPHVHEALLRANLGRKLSRAHRKKLSEAHLGSKRQPPNGRAWTEREDELVRNLPPEDAAKNIGRTLAAVILRRSRLGLSDGRTRKERRKTGRSK
jgi:hypothetical protein